MRRTLFLVLWGFVFFGSIYLVRIREDMVDFKVNYRAAQRLMAGESLYRTQDGHFMFKYLPFSAFLYIPLTLLRLETAKAIWYALSVLGAIGCFYLSYRLVGNDGQHSPYLVIFPPLILAKFFFRELALGQINVLITLILLLMIWFLGRPSPREAKAGFLWGLASALKPYGLIFLPYLVVKRKWKAVAVGLGFIGLASVLPFLFYGLSGNARLHVDWLASLSQSTPSLLTSNDNISVLAFLAKWGASPSLAVRVWVFWTILMGMAVLAIMGRGKGVKANTVLEGSILLTLVPLVSPMGWDYQLLMSVLAVTLLFHYFDELSRLGRALLIADFCVISLTLYDIMGRELYGQFMAWSLLTPCFVLLLGYVGYLRFRQVC